MQNAYAKTSACELRFRGRKGPWMRWIVGFVAIAIAIWAVIRAVNLHSSARRTGTEGRPPRAISVPSPASETPRGRAYPIAVVGEQYRNHDGTDRQAAIRQLTPGEAVDLVPEPNNEHDPGAVLVCDRNGRGIGYLPADRAFRISDEIRGGKAITADVREILAPHDGRGFWSVVLTVYFP